MRTFKTRDIKPLTVSGHGHAVAAARQGPFPQRFLGLEVETIELSRGAEIEFAGDGAGADALHVVRFRFAASRRLDALDPSETSIHVEDQNARAAELEVVANTRRGHVEVVKNR